MARAKPEITHTHVKGVFCQTKPSSTVLFFISKYLPNNKYTTIRCSSICVYRISYRIKSNINSNIESKQKKCSNIMHGVSVYYSGCGKLSHSTSNILMCVCAVCMYVVHGTVSLLARENRLNDTTPIHR